MSPILDLDYNDITVSGGVEILTGGASSTTKIIANVAGETLKSNIDVKSDGIKTIADEKSITEATVDVLAGQGGGLLGKSVKLGTEGAVDIFVTEPLQKNLDKLTKQLNKFPTGSKNPKAQDLRKQIEVLEENISIANAKRDVIGTTTNVGSGGVVGAKGEKFKKTEAFRSIKRFEDKIRATPSSTRVAKKEIIF